MAECGYAINAGNHAGFGMTSNVAGSAVISGNHMEENQFGCVLVAISYADLTISDNTLTNCDLAPGIANGAVDIQALAPATTVAVIGNDITRAGPTTAGNIGVLIQNMPASPGNLASVLVDGNRIHGLTAAVSSDAIRLGPTIIARAPADIDIDIVGNTLTGNSRGMSWQTNAGNDLGLNLDVHRNRFAGNTARAISLFGAGRTLDAENNWFGCNAGPSVGVPMTPCDSIGVGTPASSSVDFSPWLVLSVAAAPTEIGLNGETSAITASLTANSDGGVVGSPIPDDTLIGFTTDLGSIAPASDGTSGGVANATLTSDASTGIATVTATLDAQGVTAEVSIQAQLGKVVVLAQIEAADPTGDTATDKNLEKAIDSLQKSLEPDLWLDADHLTPKKGKKVFDEERKAVSELGKIKNPGSLAGDIASWIDTLVAVDRALAQTAIDEAPAGKEKDKAIDELAKGDAEAADDDFDKAIEHYGHTWKALKD